MSRLTVGSLEGLSENSNVISVPTGHTLNVADAGALQIGGSGVVSAGLVHISRTTIGSAVSSVTVSNAFSTDYDNYRIIISGGASSANTDLGLQLGATTSSYYYQLIYGSYGASVSAEGTTSGTSHRYAGTAVTASLFACIDIQNPFLAEQTFIQSNHIRNTVAGVCRGYLPNTSSYTAFTIAPNTGTLTGGTIDVYGYAKA